jgi:hypothetical protein
MIDENLFQSFYLMTFPNREVLEKETDVELEMAIFGVWVMVNDVSNFVSLVQGEFEHLYDRDCESVDAKSLLGQEVEIFEGGGI